MFKPGLRLAERTASKQFQHWFFSVTQAWSLLDTATIWDPYHQHGLTYIPACISSHVPSKVWDVITYSFPNFNGCTLEVWEWDNYISMLGEKLNFVSTLQWRHNELDSVSNHQPRDCLLNRLFRRRSKKTSKLRVTGLCAGNSPGTGEFPAQIASNAENVSIWWRHRSWLQ